jgi:hypothetical protein
MRFFLTLDLGSRPPRTTPSLAVALAIGLWIAGGAVAVAVAQGIAIPEPLPPAETTLSPA